MQLFRDFVHRKLKFRSMPAAITLIVIGLAIAMWIGAHIPNSIVRFNQDISTRATDWSDIFAAILDSLAWIIVPAIVLGIVAVVADTAYYYAQFRRPYLLGLLGHSLPVDAERKLADAEQIEILQLATRRAIRDAQLISRRPLDDWPSHQSYMAEFVRFVGRQCRLIASSFSRDKDQDVVRAFVMVVREADPSDHTANENNDPRILEFLPSELWPDDREPLLVMHSLAGRAVRQSVGDAVTIVNVSNVHYEVDFDAMNEEKSYLSLLCIPIIGFGRDSRRSEPTFVLSIDSALGEAFGSEYVGAAMAISSCIGIVGQRWLEMLGRSPNQ